MEQEGVVKYRLAFKHRRLKLDPTSLDELNHNRQAMLSLGLLGQNKARYDGYGFGNISLRCVKASEAFWISGTQTGHLEKLANSDLSLVTRCYPNANTVVAQGETQPSSESMTHGVLYQFSTLINAVIHVHSPDIWHKATKLKLLSTPADIPYGTPEMANSVRNLAKSSIKTTWPLIFVMKGHEDGIVAAGESLHECTQVLINTLKIAQTCG